MSNSRHFAPITYFLEAYQLRVNKLSIPFRSAMPIHQREPDSSDVFTIC